MKSNICSVYRLSNKDRIHQGDLLRNFDFNYVSIDDTGQLYNDTVTLPYALILSQECDLENDFNSRQSLTREYDKLSQDKIKSYNDKLMQSILISPAFPSNKLREGTHLSEHEHVLKINSKNWKIVKQNNNPRYHFLRNHY
ncbi:MAG: hypothetical protein FWH29_04940 [Methanobrevibacter sp.]|nr:hypothetical protein [Methanobrevibacter sp.]